MALLHDFGGDGPALHLAHANGFPPGTYQLLAEQLTSDFHVFALPSRPLWPGSLPQEAPNWQVLAQDLIRGLDEVSVQAITGVGHSLGGVLTLWAAIWRPDLFERVILIDPVILPPFWLWSLRLMRALGRERQPLVQGALHRRRAWTSRQACYEHYRAKPFFEAWSDAALYDYVESGTIEKPGGGVELAYPPEWEAHIFGTTPLGIWRDVGHLRCPALFIRGERSNTFQPQAEARLARRLPQARFVTIPGAGHLLPMEKPEEVGEEILRWRSE